jgi:hypothetical protein
MLRKLQSASALGFLMLSGMLTLNFQQSHAGIEMKLTRHVIVDGTNPSKSAFDISGKVTGDNGEELPGVSLMLTVCSNLLYQAETRHLCFLTLVI